jgi:uncharacterized membrane protein YphA (DoxX/SURF4 family)
MSIALIARLILGLPLVVFGLNGFLHYFEPPVELPVAGMAFLEALEATGYMLPLVSGTEVLSGVMILTGLFLPLGLTLIAPVLVNIVSFHVYLDDPKNGAVGYVMTLCALILAWSYRSSFAGVLAPFAQRSGSKA